MSAPLSIDLRNRFRKLIDTGLSGREAARGVTRPATSFHVDDAILLARLRSYHGSWERLRVPAEGSLQERMDSL